MLTEKLTTYVVLYRGFGGYKYADVPLILAPDVDTAKAVHLDAYGENYGDVLIVPAYEGA
tara:strand:- start:604 stop:783 length:180 start_codon:yes stop_codon:yes gene_type:complete